MSEALFIETTAFPEPVGQITVAPLKRSHRQSGVKSGAKHSSYLRKEFFFLHKVHFPLLLDIFPRVYSMLYIREVEVT